MLLSLFKLVDDRVCLRSGLGGKLLRLVLRHLDLALGLCLGALELFFRLRLLLLCGEGRLTRSFQLVRQLLAADLQTLDNILELAALGGGQQLGAFNDVILHPEALADRESVALAGYADEQLIGRAQGGHVKFTAAVFHALRFQREFLELGIVSGGGDLCAALTELFEDGDRQRRALNRVGTGAQLVDHREGGAVAEL